MCKFGLDRSSLSWLSSIAVSLSARSAARRDLKFMWKCVQNINVEMFAKKRYVTFAKIPKANNVTLMIIQITRNDISHEFYYAAAARLMRGWPSGPSP